MEEVDGERRGCFLCGWERLLPAAEEDESAGVVVVEELGMRADLMVYKINKFN
jgi:hypothetical protein